MIMITQTGRGEHSGSYLPFDHANSMGPAPVRFPFQAPPMPGAVHHTAQDAAPAFALLGEHARVHTPLKPLRVEHTMRFRSTEDVTRDSTMNGNGPDEPDADALKADTGAGVVKAQHTSPLPDNTDNDEDDTKPAKLEDLPEKNERFADSKAPTQTKQAAASSTKQTEKAEVKISSKDSKSITSIAPKEKKATDSKSLPSLPAVPSSVNKNPATAKPKPKVIHVHPCVPNGKGQCTVSFPSHAIEWKTKTVPAGTFKDLGKDGKPLPKAAAKKPTPKAKIVSAWFLPLLSPCCNCRSC